jgi:hypothetical protein
MQTIMKFIQSLALLALSLILWTSCENDGFYYRDEARIRLVGPEIWTVGSDSLEFSFISYTDDVTEVAMEVDAQVMGNTVDYDRTANISVVSSKTTASASLYSVPSSVTIPANSGKGTFQVILKRGDILNTQSVSLYLQVEASDDFAVGVNEENHLLLKWSNTISKPSNWDDELAEHFGTYSETKYRFMLSNAGESVDFTSTMSWSALHNYNIRFTNALNDYNAAHPGQTLTDENGALVTFPQK